MPPWEWRRAERLGVAVRVRDSPTAVPQRRYNRFAMATKKPPRRRPVKDTETAVFVKSARRCALCFGLHGDLQVKKGQIAHLDGDRSNSAEDNLAFLCFNHHTDYDSKTSQHKNYTIDEVKHARSRLYAYVAEGKHLTPAAALPHSNAEADKQVLRDFLEVVPSNGSIRFLRTNNFNFSFETKRLEDIERFACDRGGPEHEFLDAELESARVALRERCIAFLGTLVGNAFPTNNANREGVPSEWEDEQPERFKQAVMEISEAADVVCESYDSLVRMARRKLGV